MLAESQAYEQGVSAGLKEQVYEALVALAQGFLDYPNNGLAPAAAKKKPAARAKAEAASRQAGQMSMLDDSAFAGSMRTASRFMDDIERLGSETLADVHESERIYVETVRKTT